MAMEIIYSGFSRKDRNQIFEMKFFEKKIPEVLVLEPKVHIDERGYFMETFRASIFKDRGIKLEFVQDNQSSSRRGTLRGLHYQLQSPQGKLVRVVSGEVFDVAVDLRKSSKTFGGWVGEILSAENKRQLWVPPGFAHGFLVLSDQAELSYKCTDYFNPADEHILLWNDLTVAIDWPVNNLEVILSGKDRQGASLSESEVFD